MSDVIKNRFEFVYLYDVENGNPNGDPDAGNMPRIDPETSHGIVTDVCLKRKVRNYVQTKYNNSPPYRIFIQEMAVLNNIQKESYDALGTKPPKKGSKKGKDLKEAQKWMCENFFDIRTFGAVMSTDVPVGTVRGPVQINFSKSKDPILQQEVTITRMAVATKKESIAQKGDNRTMGRKYIVPYGLYRVEGYISANLAKKTGFSEDDLELLWDAFRNMFDHDHSAARGKMNARKLVIFKHESALGNAPAHKLFELVNVTRKSDSTTPARSYDDYEVTIDYSNLPTGVEILPE